AMTCLLACGDPTANSAAWAVHLLCDAPDEVGALRSELDAVLGADRVPRELERAHRLQPPPAGRPQAAPPLLGECATPPGTGAVALMRLPATDGKHFADPQAFRPARWLGGPAHNDDT